MSFWTAVVVVAAIWAVVSVIRAKHNAAAGFGTDEEGKLVSNGSRHRERERELKDEIARLRERLEVLERIATEDRETKRLSAEIESLRQRD